MWPGDLAREHGGQSQQRRVVVSWQVLIVLAEFAVVCAVIGAGTLVQRVRRRGKQPATRS